MTKMTSVHVDDLSGPALVWALDSVDPPPTPSLGQMALPFGAGLDEARGESLRLRHDIWIEPGHSNPWLSCVSGNPLDRRIGETRVIAIFRAVVAFKIGETVNVPRELMP